MYKVSSILGIVILLIFIGINLKGFTNFYYNYSGNYIQATNKQGEFNSLLKRGNKLYSNSTLSGSTKDETIDFLEQSIMSYSQALDILPSEYVAKNLEFVQEKLRILKLKQQRKQQQEQKETKEQNATEAQKGTGEKGEKNDSQKSEGEAQQGEGEEQNGERTDTQEGSEAGKEENNGKKSGENNESGESKGLSEETKKILEEQAQQLKKQQGEIGKFYNKNYKEPSNSPFDNFADFFGKTQFDNSLLDENDEKDW